MNIRLISFAVILLLTPRAGAVPEGGTVQIASAGQNLVINLPNEVTISGENLTLGQIAEVKGDEALTAKAKEVMLGRISVAGQMITIDRPMITSRLMCSEGEIAKCRPEFTGSEKVTVSRAAKIIKSETIVESAVSLLERSIKDASIAKWEPAREPADLVLAGQPENVELKPRLVSRGAGGQANLEISVIADGVAAGSRQVSFRPKYNIKQAVTVTDVKKGEIFTADNTKIEKTVSDEPQSVNLALPYGFAAARNLSAGTILNPGMTKTPLPEVAIERNQTVVIRIDSAGLVVTAMGKAMQQGGTGDYIKVRNADSQRVITAKINEDGTVEPVL